MDGIINLDKPPHITSARVVGAVKYLLPRGIRIGHAGTLDTFATGVLLLLVGNSTRKCEQMMSLPKTYQATIKLGAVTQTDDPDSPEQVYSGSTNPIRKNMEGRSDSAHAQIMGGPPSREEIESLIPRFTGALMQIPPKYSALKIAGRRASDRVRAGQEVGLKPRPVEVYSFRLIDYSWPFVRVEIECGRGTYIRSIARDLGEALGVGGYVTELRRTRIGPFDVASAVALSSLTPQNVGDFLMQLS
jgi:tRNA pseudouridine55 synthase